MPKTSIMKPATSIKAEMDIYQGFIAFILSCETKGLAKATITNYKRWYNGYFSPFTLDYCAAYSTALVDGVTMRVCDLDSDFLCPTFRAWLTAKKTLSDYSINTYITYYAIFYKFFAKKGLIAMRTFGAKHLEPPIKTLYTDEQLLALLEPPKDRDNFAEMRTWVVVNYILGTGNRRASVVNITMADCTDLAQHNHVRLTHTKNGKQQIVYVPEVVKAIMIDYIRTWRASAAPTDYLFCNCFGEKFSVDGFAHTFQEYATRRLGENAPKSLHLLRHQFAATYLRTGGHIEDLKKALNHKSFSQVMWYADKYDVPAPEKNEPFNVFHTLTTPKHRKIKKK